MWLGARRPRSEELLLRWQLAAANRAARTVSQACATSDVSLNAQGAVNGGNGTEATALWGALEEGLSNVTDAVDWYNVLRHHVPDDAAAADGLIEGAGGWPAHAEQPQDVPYRHR